MWGVGHDQDATGARSQAPDRPTPRRPVRCHGGQAGGGVATSCRTYLNLYAYLILLRQYSSE